MQDSLDDYIKIIRNVKSEEPIKLKKDVQISAQRKKECDMRAMKIVEFSIEGKLRPEIFTRCLPYINQSHYQDIVEERAITKLCGYSICGKKIADMPKKQYYISTKSNKVYDITDRKNYCSNFCYKASLHIKKQIDESPLWLRKLDDIPEYQLLELSDGGLPGEYIDQGVAKPVVEPSFTPVSIFTDVSLKDMIETERTKDSQKDKITRKGIHKKVSKLLKTTMQTINENVENTEEEEMPAAKEATRNSKKLSQKKHDHPSPTLPVIEEKEERLETKEIDDCIKKNSETNSKMKKPKKKSAKTHKSEVESIIRRVLKEWLTLESYIFLYGESRVKEVLNEKKLSDYFDKLNIAELQRDKQVKYMDICRKLQLQEMADEKFDNALLGNTKLKPVPDYKKLKEENKDLNLKVKCFYSGTLHEKEDTNFPTVINKTNECDKQEEIPTILPLVDVNSQNAMRRKIFLTSMNKSMQQLLLALRVPSITSVLSDLQKFVRTFKLKADNIVFKPLMWNYLAVVLLNILSIQDQNIRSLLEERSAQEYIDLQLSSLPSKNCLISDIITNIQDIDMFVENYISSN